MKSDRAFLVFSKAVAAFTAFCLGFATTILLCAAAASQIQTGDSLLSSLLDLGVSLFVLCGVGGLGGVIAAGILLLFHPTATLRVAFVILGLFLMGMGVLLIVFGTGVTRFLWGPLSLVGGVYPLWTGLFGKRSDVENL